MKRARKAEHEAARSWQHGLGLTGLLLAAQKENDRLRAACALALPIVEASVDAGRNRNGSPDTMLDDWKAFNALRTALAAAKGVAP